MLHLCNCPRQHIDRQPVPHVLSDGQSVGDNAESMQPSALNHYRVLSAGFVWCCMVSVFWAVFPASFVWFRVLLTHQKPVFRAFFLVMSSGVARCRVLEPVFPSSSGVVWCQVLEAFSSGLWGWGQSNENTPWRVLIYSTANRAPLKSRTMSVSTMTKSGSICPPHQQAVW